MNELVGLLFLNIVFEYSVKVNVFNSNVLLPEGPLNYIFSDGGPYMAAKYR